MEAINLAILSTGEPTYWPSDNKKMHDLLDFGIIRYISKDYCHTESCLQLFLDHSPVIFTINSKIMIKGKLAFFATPKQNGPISQSY